MQNNVLPYALIDSGHFKKLEQVGPYKIVRPAAGAVWSPSLDKSHWHNVDAQFERFSEGKGKWTQFNPDMPEAWLVAWGNFNLEIKPTSFGHLGLFAEQVKNWSKIEELCFEGSKNSAEFKVLNLFAYTGGSTLAAARGGAHVTHIDASKPSVDWARKNAEVSGLAEAPVRWITEDVQKFVEREVSRGNKYQGIILDPPTYGRGPKNQIWKIEDHLLPLLKNIKSILAEDYGFILLSCHSQGYTPLALKNILLDLLGTECREVITEEMIIPSETHKHLPSGATCFYIC